MSPGIRQNFHDRIAALLCALFFLQGLCLVRETSPTADEIPFHMVNGYAYLKTRDYRMSPANPAMLREWMALPWLVLKPRLDLEKKSWAAADSENFGKEFFYKDNRSAADRLLYASRFMILLLGTALGIVVFLWSRSLYGAWGGILSLAIYAFCPNFLAHSAIAHTDVGVTLFLTLSAFFLWRYLEYSRTLDLWGLVFSFGFACAAKYNALFFSVPLFLILVLRKGLRTSLKAAALCFLSTFFVIWFTYGFEFKPILGGVVPRIDEKLSYVSAISQHLFPGQENVENFLKRIALQTPVPIPTYLLGIAGMLRSHQAPYLHYAFGEWTTKARWYYYIFCFVTKMTLLFLALLFLRIVFFRKAGSPSGNENWVVWPLTATVFIVTAFDTAGQGIRYLFPVIPILFVWIGGLVRPASKSKIAIGVLCAVVILNPLTTLPVFPNYLSYFNPLIGGVMGGYCYVRGSDVDWGQGLKGLKNHLDKNAVPKVSLRYFGSADPSFYGISYEPVSEAESKVPDKKVYAISLFYLEHMEWSRRIKPTALVGGSIFVYDLR